jgi:hypothetical protein
MNMRKRLLATAFLAMGAVSSQALEITVTGAANSTAKGTSSEGTLTTIVADLIVDNVSSNGTLGHTITGLSLDTTGAGNDSVRIEFYVNGDGNQILQTSGTGSAGWLSPGGTTLNANGEYIQLSNTLVRVDLNGVPGSGSGSFVGFTKVAFGSWNADGSHVATANGLATPADGSEKILVLPSDPTLKTWFDTTANTGAPRDAAGSWRPEGWDFVIDVVQSGIAETAFTGAVDSDWNTAGNWTNGVPTASALTYVNSNLTANIGGGSVSALSLEVAGIVGQSGTVTNGTLTIGQTTSIAVSSNTTGVVDLTSITAGAADQAANIATAPNANGRLVTGSGSLIAADLNMATFSNSVGVLDLGTGSLSANAESVVSSGIASSGTVDVATLDMNSVKIAIGTARDSYGRVTAGSASGMSALTMGSGSNSVAHFEATSGLTTHGANIYTAVARDSEITMTYPDGLALSGNANFNIGDGRDSTGTLTASSLTLGSGNSDLILNGGRDSTAIFNLGGGKIIMSYTNDVRVGAGIGSSHNLTTADFAITGPIGNFNVGEGTGEFTNLFNTHETVGPLDVLVPF